MNTLPEDIQDTIYRYKHQLEFKQVAHEINKFKRNSMRARPLLCDDCYRSQVDVLCEDCLYEFEIKMEWLNDPPNWVDVRLGYLMSDCECDLNYDSDFSI